MSSMGVYEAKTHFAQLLERVAQGEHITITKHGVPVAVLQPVDPDRQQSVEETIRQIEAFGQRNRLDGLSIKEMIEEGRA